MDFPLSLGDAIQGGAGLIAAYLAIQIKRIVDNHEVRITKLEGRRKARAKSKPSARNRGGPRRRRR